MVKKKVFSISNALHAGLEETISAGQNYAGQLRIEAIPLLKIELDPENPRDHILEMSDLKLEIQPNDFHYERKRREKAALASLAESIKEHGVINPIIVYKRGDKYRLVAGERRTFASILAGRNDIQAKILDSKPNDLKISLLQWIENVERSDLSLSERLLNLEKIAGAYSDANRLEKPITVTEMSKLLGCTKPHAMTFRSVLYADRAIKDLIHANQVRNLEKAALIANAESKIMQQRLTTACLDGASLKSLKAMAVENVVRIKRLPTRSNQAVNFGSANVTVAGTVIRMLLQQPQLNTLATQMKETDFKDAKQLSSVFQQLLKKLESTLIEVKENES